MLSLRALGLLWNYISGGIGILEGFNFLGKLLNKEAIGTRLIKQNWLFNFNQELGIQLGLGFYSNQRAKGLGPGWD